MPKLLQLTTNQTHSTNAQTPSSAQHSPRNPIRTLHRNTLQHVNKRPLNSRRPNIQPRSNESNLRRSPHISRKNALPSPNKRQRRPSPIRTKYHQTHVRMARVKSTHQPGVRTFHGRSSEVTNSMGSDLHSPRRVHRWTRRDRTITSRRRR